MRIFILFCLLLAAVDSQNYCSISSDHTMCRFGEGPGWACGEGSCGGLSREEIEAILRAHNELRSTVASGGEKRGAPGPQPPAANMQSLIWDDRLAEVAQRWADQCTFQHDKCRDDPRFPVGQNIFWSSGLIEPDWGRAVRQWYGEVAEMRPHLVHAYAHEQHTAHYTQMVWARTRYVGCGRRGYAGSYRLRGSVALRHLLGGARPANTTAGYANETRVDAGQASGAAEGNATAQKRTARMLADLVKPTRLDFEALAMPKIGENIHNRDWFYPNSTKYMQSYAHGKYTRPVNSDIFSNKESSDDSSESSSSESSSSESFSPISESTECINRDENKRKPGVIILPPDTIELISWTSEGWKMVNYDWSDDQILVCNYGPTGNIVGQPIYEVGRPCSKCLGTLCIEGLCA